MAKQLTVWQLIKLLVGLVIIFGSIMLFGYLNGMLLPSYHQMQEERVRYYLEQTPLKGGDYKIEIGHKRQAKERR